MFDWKKNVKGSLTKEEKLRYLNFLVVPFVILVLILIIVIMDNTPKTGKDLSGSERNQTADSSLSNGSTDQTLLADDELKKDAVPEINALMETYFQAKLACDPQAMARVYGNQEMAEDPGLAEKLRQQTEHIEEYQNITCYTKNGLDADSAIVFVKFDVKFYNTETLAPSLLWGYVTKTAEGGYRIVDEPDQQANEYIVRAKKSKDVYQLASLVNSALEEAIASDDKLASIYNILRDAAVQTEPDATGTAPSQTEPASASPSPNIESQTE